MRLDHFLPVLNKPKGRPPRPMRWPAQLARKLFPGSWVSEVQPRRVGALRRWLKRLGPTWLSSPMRRVIQGFCFIAFLWLFFYACWPYRAQPAPVWQGWLPVEIDAATGASRLTAILQLPDSVKPGVRLHVSDESLSGQKTSLGPFLIERVAIRSAPNPSAPAGTLSQSPTAPGSSQITELQLRPEHPLPPEALDALSLSTGPWSLSPQAPGVWPSHYADDFAAQDRVPVETFLLIDPLVSISTALAAKAWMWSLWGAAVILVVCVFVPRGFCGYLCPLGTLIDLFDWAVAGRVKRFRVPDDGWWVHLKYYLLFGVLVAGLGGVLLSGFVSAIPVLTRGLLFLLAPLQLGFMRGWHQVPPIDAGQIFSLLLFFAVLGLGFLRPRFWCKYVCPSGAVFSLGNIFRVSERKVEDTCIHCNKCVEICPFDAIKPDFTTRVTDCTLCQTCGGVCPTHAIKFVERTNRFSLKPVNDPPTHEHAVFSGFAKWIGGPQSSRSHPPKGAEIRHEHGQDALGSTTSKEPNWLLSLAAAPMARRSFVASGLGMMAGLAGGAGAALATKTFGARLHETDGWRPVRPPGSVPEKAFLELCIRCGECFKVCPNNVLHPLGFQQGLEGLWTPHVVADWAGCEPSCNACGKACPTGAIRALPLEEKKAAHMGLALVNEKTCLPWAGEEACQLCVDECTAAGYHAIEFIRVHGATDAAGKPIAGTGFLAPQVQADKCVGCGLCQTRCFAINVKTKKLLEESAIIIEAGEGKEDRLMKGSYVSLRSSVKSSAPKVAEDAKTQSYLPEFLKE